MESNLYLIVGLGNPGRKYEQTRHNIGWQVLDTLAQRFGLRFDRKERKAMTAAGTIRGQRVLLAKPTTFMNASGEAVRALKDYYRVDLDHLILVHDDLDIPLGTLRLRQSGGAGGQKGVRSTIQHLGTQDFSRVRVGIGRPPGKMDPAAYVLQPFRQDDAILAQEVAERAADALEAWINDGIDQAMTRFNGDISQPAAPAPDPAEQLKLYLRAHELAPTDPGPVEKIIGALKGQRRPDEAAGWHLRAAELYDRRGETGKALDHRERAASLQPERTDLHHAIADAYLRLDNKKKAVQRYLILARHLDAAGQIMAAIDAVNLALQINPQHPRALEMQIELQQRLTM